jgi:EmrB/QacA subfamily drug resistance transporter
LALTLVLAAMFMAQFDLYVVNVAAPSLSVDLGAGPAALELIVGGYAFTYAAGLITGGRLGDLLGHRRMFITGTAAFTVASLLCGLAQTPTQLVVVRLLQGLTAALMVPQVLALITAMFPPQQRARALAWFGVTMGVGAVAGQVLGGALLQADVLGLGWRAIFLVNVPIGIIAVLFSLRLLPAAASAARPRLDVVGVIGISGALALVLVPLVIGRSEGWPLWAWISLVASVPVMILSLMWERRLGARGGQPMLDVGLFGDSVFNKGLLVNVGVFASFHSWMFTMTLMLQAGIGLTPLAAGLTFTPLGVAFAVSSVGGRPLVARWGSGVITLGTVIAAAGLAAMVVVLSIAGGSANAFTVIVPMMIVGLGNGLAVPAMIGTVLAGVQPAKAGAAAGVLTTAQQFAGAAGIAVIGGVFFQTLDPERGAAGYATSLIWVSGMSLAVALLAAAVSTRLPRPARPVPVSEPVAYKI